MKLNWSNWKYVFVRGRTKAVYGSIALVALSLYTIYLNHVEFYPFIFSLVAVLSSYGMFTDFVAHLLWDRSKSDLSFKEWVGKIFKGRTHDVYGLIIISAMISLVEFRLGMIVSIISVLIFIYIAKARFYH